MSWSDSVTERVLLMANKASKTVGPNVVIRRGLLRANIEHLLRRSDKSSKFSTKAGTTGQSKLSFGSLLWLAIANGQQPTMDDQRLPTLQRGVEEVRHSIVANEVVSLGSAAI